MCRRGLAMWLPGRRFLEQCSIRRAFWFSYRDINETPWKKRVHFRLSQLCHRRTMPSAIRQSAPACSWVVIIFLPWLCLGSCWLLPDLLLRNLLIHSRGTFIKCCNIPVWEEFEWRSKLTAAQVSVFLPGSWTSLCLFSLPVVPQVSLLNPCTYASFSYRLSVLPELSLRPGPSHHKCCIS